MVVGYATSSYGNTKLLLLFHFISNVITASSRDRGIGQLLLSASTPRRLRNAQEKMVIFQTEASPQQAGPPGIATRAIQYNLNL